MKTIRLIAASMFLITGILHIYWAFTGLIDFPSFALVAFGVLYCAIGVLLIMKMRFALWLGLIPIIPMAMTLSTIDFKNLDWTLIWFPIELIAVICCIILLISKDKG